MTTPDPLDNIMSTLRQRGGIDPETQARRKADLQRQRRTAGVPGRQQAQGQRGVPQQQREIPERQPRDELGQILDDIGGDRAEATKEGEIGAAEEMDRVLTDQLNEAILSLKVKIGREQDRDRRKQLENQAKQIRQQVIELGGEPIYADETVEEGLQKLRGKGYIGRDRLNEMIGSPGGGAGEELFRQAQAAGTGVLDQGQAQRGAWEEPRPDMTGPAYEADRQIDGMQAVRPYLEHRGAEVDWDPDAGEVIARGPAGEQRLTPADIEDPGVAYAEQDDLTRMLTDIGLGPDEREVEEPRDVPEDFEDFYEPAVDAPPEPDFNPQAVNQIVREYGLEPKSEEQIRKQADAMVRRQALGKRQAVERQIERFEDEFPTEFDRAKEQIEEHAAELTAERQEEMSARGMYYSSVMADAVSEIDETAQQEIAEISSEAANYVADLHRDLQEIEEWKAVEREALRHEMMAEERQQGMKVAQMRLSAQEHADRFALDTWSAEQQMLMEDRQQQFQHFQFEVERAMQEQGMAATASVMRQPMFQEYLEGQGMTLREFEQLPLEQQATMAEQAPQMMEFQLNRENAMLENRLLAEEVNIQEKYGKEKARLAYQQAGLDVRQKEMEVQEHKKRLDAMGDLDYFRTMYGMEVEGMAQDLAMGDLEMEVLETELEYLPAMMESEMAAIQADIRAAEEADTDDEFYRTTAIERADQAEMFFQDSEFWVDGEEIGMEGDVPNYSLIMTEIARAKRRAEQVEDDSTRDMLLSEIRDVENVVTGHGAYKRWKNRNDPEKLEEEVRELESYGDMTRQQREEWDDPIMDGIPRTFRNMAEGARQGLGMFGGIDLDLDQYTEDDTDFRTGDDLYTLEDGQLTEHFHAQEFADTATGEARVDPEMVHRLEQMRQEIDRPIHITSGYRSPERQEQLRQQGVAVADDSRHMYGDAADIQVPGMSPEEVAEVARRYFDGIGIYSNHVHVDTYREREWRG